MFSSVGPTEIILILIVALLVFGPQKLPEVGKSIGRGLREFRRASQEMKDEFIGGLDDESPPPPTYPTAVAPPPDADAAATTPGSIAEEPPALGNGSAAGGEVGSHTAERTE